MTDPVTVHVKSITTTDVQTLILDRADGEQMRGKKVLVVDDVISTGESLAAVEKLMAEFDVNIVCRSRRGRRGRQRRHYLP